MKSNHKLFLIAILKKLTITDMIPLDKQEVKMVKNILKELRRGTKD